MPRTWSPSTTRPAASTAISRSASPSRANPTSAPRAATSAASDAGAVAPDSTLMFTPSGSLWMTSTVAPVAARISGPDDRRPSRSRSRGRSAARPPRSIAASAEPVVAVAIEELRRDDRPADLGVADAAELLGPPDELLELVLDRVVELEARRDRGP